jgi:hypothetical protein
MANLPGQNLTNQKPEKEFPKEPAETPQFEIEKKLPEQIPEKIKEAIGEAKIEIKKEEPKPEILKPSTQISTKIIKSQTLKEIENILEEDLEEIYFGLPQNKKVEFKQKGEETASKIEVILFQVKIRVSQILNLIKEWLKLIPGVNKFFLEQEAKIKTDKILQLSKKDEKEKTKELDIDGLI